jgi:hypothetical protein
MNLTLMDMDGCFISPGNFTKKKAVIWGNALGGVLLVQLIFGFI